VCSAVGIRAQKLDHGSKNWPDARGIPAEARNAGEEAASLTDMDAVGARKLMNILRIWQEKGDSKRI
jgi:hypothetical protein